MNLSLKIACFLCEIKSCVNCLTCANDFWIVSILVSSSCLIFEKIESFINNSSYSHDYDTLLNTLTDSADFIISAKAGSTDSISTMSLSVIF